jgi:hypothetical protein
MLLSLLLGPAGRLLQMLCNLPEVGGDAMLFGVGVPPV